MTNINYQKIIGQNLFVSLTKQWILNYVIIFVVFILYKSVENK